LKKAALWGRFLEKPETNPATGPADLVALLDAAKKRMEAYLMLEPEVYREIHESMERHDYFSVRAEAKAEVAAAMLEDGMSVAKVAELTGLTLATVEALSR